MKILFCVFQFDLKISNGIKSRFLDKTLILLYKETNEHHVIYGDVYTNNCDKRKKAGLIRKEKIYQAVKL